MEITATLVKQLRDRTGAPMMDCKQALAENQGDLTQAEVWLRKKGIAAAAKKAARTASEGSIGVYVHAGGKIGGCPASCPKKRRPVCAQGAQAVMMLEAVMPRACEPLAVRRFQPPP